LIFHVLHHVELPSDSTDKARASRKFSPFWFEDKEGSTLYTDKLTDLFLVGDSLNVNPNVQHLVSMPSINGFLGIMFNDGLYKVHEFWSPIQSVPDPMFSGSHLPSLDLDLVKRFGNQSAMCYACSAIDEFPDFASEHYKSLDGLL